MHKGKVILKWQKPRTSVSAVPRKRERNELDEKITKINQSINELEEKKKTVVEEYDAKITAAKERIKSLEAKKQEILAPKAPRKPVRRKSRKFKRL